MKKIFAFILIIISSFTHAELLNIGNTAPDFTLKDQNGEPFTLSEQLKKGPVVIVFYPMDNSPVCTKQLCELRDNYSILTEYNVQVVGINPADTESHKNFAQKNNYQFPILSDPEKTTIKAYKRKGLLGTKRAVYIVNKEQKIIFAKEGKPPVEEIINAIKGNK